MLEPGDCGTEDESVAAEDDLGGRVVAVNAVVVAPPGVEPGAEAGTVPLEVRRQLAGLEAFDRGEYLRRLRQVVEIECGLGRKNDAALDGRAGDLQLAAVGEAALGGGERLGRPVLGTQDTRLEGGELGGQVGLLRVRPCPAVQQRLRASSRPCSQ